jgi:hypothetical protein
MAKPQLKLKGDKAKPQPTNNLTNWQKDLMSVGFLYVLVLFLFSDFVFQNKVFTTGGDISAGTSITKAAKDLTEKEGSLPLWFPYMFSGMPTLASGMYSDPSHTPMVKYHQWLNPMTYINLAVNVLFFNRDNSWEVAIFFFAGVFMFLLARQLGFSHLIALCAAIAYMFCNFFVGSVAAGHGGKVKTIAYIPLVVWSVMRFFKERNLLTWSAMGFVMGIFFLDPGHTQILYYGFLMLGIYFVFSAIDQFKEDKAGVIKNGLGIGSAMAVGLGFGALNYFSNFVYSDVTMRAVAPAFAEAGELAGGSSGMTFDYITMWSFHPLESITFFIPTFFGLESPYYWGWMTFTSSAFYFGLLPMIAALVAVIYRRNTVTKFLMAVAVVSLLISFGRFFEPFFKLMLAVLPFFSKFRVPSMILCLFTFSVSLLSCYGLDFIFNPSEEEKKKRGDLNRIIMYGMIALSVLLLFALLFKDGFSGMFSFMADDDAKRFNTQQLAQLKQFRIETLSGGVIRFGILGLIILSIIYFYIKDKISSTLGLSVLIIILAFDTISLNKKVLRPQTRVPASYEFQETETIKFLKSDPGNFRIFSLLEHAQSGSPMWNYFGLQSIGGYSPTKMRIYQDIIDFSLYKSSDPQFPINMNVVNMLNVKYLIANGQLPANKGFKLVKIDNAGKNLVFENTNALPRAFFVKKVLVEPDRQKIIDGLNSENFNPLATALIEKNPAAPIQTFDSSAVSVTEYRSNKITIEAYTDKPSLLVLSEIYYPHGWNAFVDGKETEIYKTNYILRSVAVPAGRHKVEFVFEPKEFELGIWVSTVSFFGVTGLMIFSLVQVFAKTKKSSTAV